MRPYQTPPTVPALDIAALAPRLSHKLLYQPATQIVDRHFYLHQRTRLSGSPYLDTRDRRLKYRANIIATCCKTCFNETAPPHAASAAKAVAISKAQ